MGIFFLWPLWWSLAPQYENGLLLTFFHVYYTLPSAKEPQRISSKHQNDLLKTSKSQEEGGKIIFNVLITSLCFLPLQGHLSEGYGKLCSIYLKLLITKMEFHIKVSRPGL